MASLATDLAPAQAVLSHSKSRLVTLDELAAIPAGESRGRRHRPVPHLQPVGAVKDAFTDRGYSVVREQFSVSHNDARLFGTVDLAPTRGWHPPSHTPSQASATRSESVAHRCGSQPHSRGAARTKARHGYHRPV